ncbi:four-carbon acid sugar kinase family protein [Pedobacter sp. P351]|uniref:four-carbon acid sugar kinase family protein n=1 Tax=Pedobacter superstes TaxID=3133441 RepID=UPI0030B7BD0A
MAVNDNRLLIAFYGDDFTGSTDALEFLSRAGVKTILFIESPTEEQLKRYNGLQAIGVAGMTRSMAPEAMERELHTAFTALKALSPRHVHYKVCSTFDSSPSIGSIGKAIDLGAKIFESEFVPLLVGAPILGRHCVFGNLFAKMGIGSEGSIYRLDRHPSMSKHPTTPADESDLRLHLGKQTSKKIGLIDILQIEKTSDETQHLIKELVGSGNEIILFDTLYQQQLSVIGELIEKNTSANKTLFSAGSSAVEMALGNYWQHKRIIDSLPEWKQKPADGNILVASGSCSPVTSGQIAYAVARGFKEIAIDTEKLALDGISEETLEAYAVEASFYIRNKSDVIIHTSRGNEDERVKRSDEVFRKKGIAKTETSVLYGTVLGRIIKLVAEKTALQRIVIAGGDTSSHAARAMGIEAVEMIAPLAPGSPLCKAYAPGSAINGLEVNFKGGQVGKEDYFEMLKGA